MQVIMLIFLITTLAPAGSITGWMPVAAFSQTGQQPQAQKPDQPVKTTAQQPVAEAGAVSTSRLALPFKPAWRHLTQDAITLPPSVDDARIYLPLTGGRVFSL